MATELGPLIEKVWRHWEDKDRAGPESHAEGSSQRF